VLCCCCHVAKMSRVLGLRPWFAEGNFFLSLPDDGTDYFLVSFLLLHQLQLSLLKRKHYSRSLAHILSFTFLSHFTCRTTLSLSFSLSFSLTLPPSLSLFLSLSASCQRCYFYAHTRTNSVQSPPNSYGCLAKTDSTFGFSLASFGADASVTRTAHLVRSNLQTIG
jgi:hypothetical protein